MKRINAREEPAPEKHPKRRGPKPRTEATDSREFYRRFVSGWMQVFREDATIKAMVEAMRAQAVSDPLAVTDQIIPLVREVLKKENDQDERDIKFAWADDYGITGKATQQTDTDAS